MMARGSWKISSSTVFFWPPQYVEVESRFPYAQEIAVRVRVLEHPRNSVDGCEFVPWVSKLPCREILNSTGLVRKLGPSVIYVAVTWTLKSGSENVLQAPSGCCKVDLAEFQSTSFCN